MSHTLEFRSTRRRVATSAFAVMIAFTAACEPTHTAATEPGNVCRPSLTTASVAPLTTVSLSGIPTTAPESLLAAVVQSPGGSGPGGMAALPATLTRSVDGSLHIELPPHPTTPMVGGDADLIVMVGNVSCTTVRITLQALPAAPGTALKVETATQSMLASLATALGSNAVQIKQPLTALPPELLALGVAQRLLDHPDNPNSLKAMINGTAPALNGQVVDMQILDALFAQSGILAAIQKLTDSLTAPPPPPTLGAASDLRATSASAVLTDQTTLFARGASVAGGVLPSQISTAADLNYWMKIQQNAGALSSPNVNGLMSELGHLFSVLAMLPSPQIKVAVAVAGATTYVYGIVVGGMQALLPSELTLLTYASNPTAFNEDATATGRWSGAKLTARGQEWKITPLTVLDGLLTSFGSAGVALQRTFTRFPFLKSIFEHAAAEAVSTITGTITNVVGVSFNFQGGAYVAGPYTYGPVDVTDAPWTLASVPPTNIIQLAAGDRTGYKPQGPGTTDLIIRTNVKFFGQNVIEKRTSITVAQISIDLQPASSTMRPGEQAPFLAIVRGADNEAVTFSATSGTISATGMYTAPQAQGTYTVTATSVSKPTRKTSVTVQVKDVITVSVSPSVTSVGPNGIAAFTATVSGTQNTAVTWSAQGGGSITANGVYTAPAAEGDYFVTARSVADITRSGTAKVTVVKPTSVPIGNTISVGGEHACGLDESGAAWCWGSNTYGQLGNGAAVGSYDATRLSSTPVAVAGGHVFSSISAGLEHTCALTPAGAAYCWGATNFGQLGDGRSAYNSTVISWSTPVAVGGGLTFTVIGAGASSTCATTSGGALVCWGFMQTIAGGTVNLAGLPTCEAHGILCALPTAIVGGNSLNLRAIVTSRETSCGVSSNGQAYCAGVWSGDGSTSFSHPPAVVTGAGSSKYVGTGFALGCVLSNSGSTSCWGSNLWGGLGSGSVLTGQSDYTYVPRPINSNVKFASLSVSVDGVCGLTDAGVAWCWGKNESGQLGYVGIPCFTGIAITCSWNPAPVTTALTFSQISAGGQSNVGSTCALTAAGDAYCWGSDHSGQLGDGRSSLYPATEITSRTPIKVLGGIKFKVSTATTATTALRSR